MGEALLCSPGEGAKELTESVLGTGKAVSWAVGVIGAAPVVGPLPPPPDSTGIGGNPKQQK